MTCISNKLVLSFLDQSDSLHWKYVVCRSSFSCWIYDYSFYHPLLPRLLFAYYFLCCNFGKENLFPLPPKMWYYTLGISSPKYCRRKEFNEAKSKDGVEWGARVSGEQGRSRKQFFLCQKVVRVVSVHFRVEAALLQLLFYFHCFGFEGRLWNVL